MNDALLQTKLYIPPLQPNLVWRPHLFEKINEGLRGKITLVSAPAGFGKTTLIADWATRISASDDNPQSGLGNPQLCWFSIDETDNDPARFLAYFIAALQRVDQAVGQDAQTMSQTPPAPPERVMTSVINDCVASHNYFLLVLDDYHLITAGSIHQALIFLVENLPPNLHLVFVGRADPPFPLARWRAQGQVTEIRQADLQFNVVEANNFLQKQLGPRISREQVSMLMSRTEGWIAGLQLAALALQAHLSQPQATNVESFLHTFTGDDRYVLDYLTDEVLQQQSAGVQAFLLQTSILKRLNGALADAVTGRGDSGELLARLEQVNLFLFPLDNQRHWYRYHQLFSDVLHSRLISQVREEDIAALHVRAAIWYEDNDLTFEAIEHALAGHDFARVGRLVTLVADVLMYRQGEVASLQRWLDALSPNQMNARPELWLIQAWMQLWTTQPDAVEANIEAALNALPPGPVPKHIRGQVATLRTQVAAQRGQTETAIAQGKEALSYLEKENGRLRGLALAAMGSGYQEKGKVLKAWEVFSEATGVFQAAEMLIPTLICRTRQGELLVDQGHLRQAEMIYRQSLRMAADQHALKLPAAGGVYIALGKLLREWNDLEQAADYTQQGIELCRAWSGFADEVLDGLLSLSQIYQAQGSPQRAMDLIQEAEEVVFTYEIPQWQMLLADYRIELWLNQGRVNDAARLASVQTDRPAEAPTKRFEKKQIILARLQLLQGATDEAVASLFPLLPLAEEDGRIGAALEMLVLLALAHYQTRRRDQALILLGKALALAEPERYVRLFLDQGPPMAALLEHALGQGMATEYVDRLLSQFITAEQGSSGATASIAAQSSQDASLLIEPLTEREREVLQLIGTGLSNSEIAEELVIAITTVKTHIKNIYGKLNVHGRFQAIERARELNLIQ